MKVIFLKDVGGVGQRNALKEVSDGYALNYLIPNGLAKQATKEAIKALENQMEQVDKATADKNDAIRAVLKQINNVTFIIKAKANDKGNLFMKINTGDIARTIGHSVTKDMISGVDLIKEMGEYDIKVSAAKTTVSVKIKVEKE
jgi:large subunit ribosomal protein L9